MTDRGAVKTEAQLTWQLLFCASACADESLSGSLCTQSNLGVDALFSLCICTFALRKPTSVPLGQRQPRRLCAFAVASGYG